MVQIIDAGPTEQSLRQQALQQAFGNIAQGVGGIAQGIQAGRQQQATARQQALGMAQEIAKSGQEVTPEMFDQLSAAAGYDPTKRYGFDALKTQPMGPPAPDAMLGSYNRQAQQVQQQRQAQTQKTQMQEQRAAAAERRAEAKEQREQQRFEAEMQKKAEQPGVTGKQMSSAEVRRVQEGADIPNILGDVQTVLEKKIDFFGPIEGRLRSMNPYDEDAQSIDASMRAASQAFGRFMEGGVLRKEDEEKYRKMFPQLSDDPDVAKNKLGIVQRLMSQKQQGQIDALRKAGYDVGAFAQTPVQPLPTILTETAQPQGMGGMLLPRDAIAADPVQVQQQIKTMSREEKLRFLQGP